MKNLKTLSPAERCWAVLCLVVVVLSMHAGLESESVHGLVRAGIVSGLGLASLMACLEDTCE